MAPHRRSLLLLLALLGPTVTLAAPAKVPAVGNDGRFGIAGYTRQKDGSLECVLFRHRNGNVLHRDVAGGGMEKKGEDGLRWAAAIGRSEILNEDGSRKHAVTCELRYHPGKFPRLTVKIHTWHPSGKVRSIAVLRDGPEGRKVTCVGFRQDGETPSAAVEAEAREGLSQTMTGLALDMPPLSRAITALAAQLLVAPQDIRDQYLPLLPSGHVTMARELKLFTAKKAAPTPPPK